MAKEALSLEPLNGGFTLRQVDGSGRASEIILTVQSVLTLARSAKRLEEQILATQNTAEISTAVHMPVAQVSLGVDLHQSEILLGMIDTTGAVERFSLPLDVAKPLAERLPVRVAEIEASIPNRTHQ